jgi:hypothetical protein
MDYQNASRIRKSSFGTLLSQQSGGFGQSFKSAISQKTKARMMGIKETFDPLNIAKKLTGGSNWAPAMLGKMFGVDKKRIDYFSGVKQRNTSSPMRSEDMNGESISIATESLGYIYKSLKMERIEKTREREEALARAESEEEFENFRNKEIIEALVGKFGKKRLRDEKGRFVKQEKFEPKKQAKSKNIFTPSKTTNKLGTTAGVVGATAVIVGGAAIVAGVGGTLGISKAIAQGESANASYNAANKGTKDNKIVGVKGPINLEDMTIAEIMRRQSIKWGSSNEDEKLFAVGKYQMIPSTLSDAVKTLNLDTSQKFTGDLQEKLFEEYLISQKRPAIANYLNSPTDDPALLYKALKALSLEWASIADPDIPGGKTSHYGSGNKASLSVEQMTILLKQDRLQLQKNRSKEVLPAPNSGNQIDVSTKENKDLRSVNATSDSPAQIINNNISSSQTKSSEVQPIVGDDTNAYQKKAKV